MGKIAFCFSGEGARGSIQAGIALNLAAKGIKPDFTIGVSSGGLCSMGYAHIGPEKLAEVWSGIKSINSVFSFNWCFPWKTGIYNQKPLEKIVANVVKHKPSIESVAVRLNVETAELQYISNMEVDSKYLAEVILCSVAIPSLVEGRNGWIDAGPRQMAPLSQAILSGCDEIYIILGRPFGLPQWEQVTGLGSFIYTGIRAWDLSLYEIMRRDILLCAKRNHDPDYRKIKLHLAQPKEIPFDAISFKDAERGVKYGSNPDNYIVLEENDILKSYK